VEEQFGHVLIEAMAGYTCNRLYLWRNSQWWSVGPVFPEGDAALLAAILERMIREPAWREEIEHYGITRVCQHYTHERIAERLVSLAQNLRTKGALLARKQSSP